MNNANSKYISEKQRHEAGYAAVWARIERETEAFMLRDVRHDGAARLRLLNQFRDERAERARLEGR